MSKYIQRDDVEQALVKEAAHLLRHYKRYMGVSDIIKELIGVVQRFPAADVAPIEHGRKIEDEGIGFFICAPCAADVCRMVRITAPIVGRKWTRRTDNVHIC